jgi:hypothetical protein
MGRHPSFPRRNPQRDIKEHTESVWVEGAVRAAQETIRGQLADMMPDIGFGRGFFPHNIADFGQSKKEGTTRASIENKYVARNMAT